MYKIVIFQIEDTEPSFLLGPCLVSPCPLSNPGWWPSYSQVTDRKCKAHREETTCAGEKDCQRDNQKDRQTDREKHPCSPQPHPLFSPGSVRPCPRPCDLQLFPHPGHKPPCAWPRTFSFRGYGGKAIAGSGSQVSRTVVLCKALADSRLWGMNAKGGPSL